MASVLSSFVLSPEASAAALKAMGQKKQKKQRKKTPTDNPKPHKRRAMFQEVDPNESEDTVEPKKKKSKGSSSVPGSAFFCWAAVTFEAGCVTGERL